MLICPQQTNININAWTKWMHSLNECTCAFLSIKIYNSIISNMYRLLLFFLSLHGYLLVNISKLFYPNVMVIYNYKFYVRLDRICPQTSHWVINKAWLAPGVLLLYSKYVHFVVYFEHIHKCRNALIALYIL